MKIFVFIRNYRKRYGQKWLEFLPKLIIYLTCAYLFYSKVSVLLTQYLNYDTTSIISYDSPEKIDFPAFTICGCCIGMATRDPENTAWNAQDTPLLEQYTAAEILEDHSVALESVVLKCFFVYDSRRPTKRKPCDQIQRVLESIHMGRKCFTYFTKIPDSTHDSAERSDTQLYTSYVYIEVNFTTTYYWTRIEDIFQDADITLSVHRANMLPTQLNAEFIRIDHCLIYDVYFRKQSTKLLPKPYATQCQEYKTNERPRSRDECLNKCILEETQRNSECLNYNNMITRGLLDDMGDEYANRKFCPQRDYLAYLKYIAARRRCLKEVCGRDCLEEEYKVTCGQSEVLACNFSDPGQVAGWSKSVIMLWPDKVMIEKVEHRESMPVYELIGYLGGHAHLWLGLSAIQLYEVVLMVGYRLVFWYRHLRMIKRAKMEKLAAICRPKETAK